MIPGQRPYGEIGPIPELIVRVDANCPSRLFSFANYIHSLGTSLTPLQDAMAGACALFGVYVASFSHYNKVYGSLVGVIIFLSWMWISNVAVLLGAELNAELEPVVVMACGLGLSRTGRAKLPPGRSGVR